MRKLRNIFLSCALLYVFFVGIFVTAHSLEHISHDRCHDQLTLEASEHEDSCTFCLTLQHNKFGHTTFEYSEDWNQTQLTDYQPSDVKTFFNRKYLIPFSRGPPEKTL